MQTFSTWYVCWQWVAAVLGIAAHAALAMPLMTAFTLLVGQHKKNELCCLGGREMIRLNLVLAVFWPIVFISDVLLQFSLVQGRLHIPDLSLWAPVMLPFSTAVVAWFIGVFCLSIQCILSRPTVDKNSARQFPFFTATGSCVCLSLLAALSFFAAQALPSCPFAGLPEGMSIFRAVMAITLSSFHVFFTYLGAAGGLTLWYLSRKPQMIQHWGGTKEDEQHAARWCTLWAMIGYIPSCLDRWGITIGFALRPGNMPAAIAGRIPTLTAFSLATVCWAVLFLRRAPRRLYVLNSLGLLFLLMGTSFPYLWAFMRNR